MKAFFEKIWDKFVDILYAIPFDKYLHFIAGLIIAAFFGITLHVEGAIFPALFAGLIKDAIDEIVYDGFDWWDVLATTAGGAVIQLFILLA